MQTVMKMANIVKKLNRLVDKYILLTLTTYDELMNMNELH